MIAFLPEENVTPLLSALSKRMDVIAPVLSGGAPVFVKWEGQDLALSDENTLVSPTEFFLPKREVFFRYVQFSGRYTFEEVPAKPRLIFGVRPCDMKSIAVLDRIFQEEPCDRAYLSRRMSTVLVALNCSRPGDDCFCLNMGAGPTCETGFDILLTRLDGGYLVETGSPAGILILKEHPEFFKEASSDMLSQKGKITQACRQTLMSKKTPDPQMVKEAMSKANWERIGESCLRCGGCSFICPTCHCFTIMDLGVPDGERVRCSDSCTLSGFSRMTSGANPRMTQGQRLHNWYLDKFEYIPGRTGLLGCVGCGRCSKVCLSKESRWTLEV